MTLESDQVMKLMVISDVVSTYVAHSYLMGVPLLSSEKYIYKMLPELNPIRSFAFIILCLLYFYILYYNLSMRLNS